MRTCQFPSVLDGVGFSAMLQNGLASWMGSDGREILMHPAIYFNRVGYFEVYVFWTANIRNT